MSDWNTTIQSDAFKALSSPETQADLASFFADHDIESLRTQALESHGIDIRGIYCLHTGRLVGTFDDFVLQFAIDEESQDDEEMLIDALVSRVVASMRPTPMLNKPDRITLLNMAEKYPADILAYLINRLHGNQYLATHRVELLEPYIWRIHCHQQWTKLIESGLDPKPWIHWLLELDAKRNLHELAPPCVDVDRLNNWMMVNIGTSLLQLVTAENSAALLGIFEQWAFARLKEYDARDKEIQQQANFLRGNSMTQNAFARSWLENPQFATKRAEAQHKAKKRAETAKPKSAKAQKLDSQVDKFMHLLSGILDGDSAPIAPSKPAPIVRTGGMLFRKKESN